jgi:hypothetical protein
MIVHMTVRAAATEIFLVKLGFHLESAKSIPVKNDRGNLKVMKVNYDGWAQLPERSVNSTQHYSFGDSN